MTDDNVVKMKQIKNLKLQIQKSENLLWFYSEEDNAHHFFADTENRDSEVLIIHENGGIHKGSYFDEWLEYLNETKYGD